MSVHTLEPERGTLQDCFDRSFPPVLTIADGDTIVYRTLDASWGRVGEGLGEARREIEADARLEMGHALSGPIAVLGAWPGDALDVEIRELQPSDWGWTWTGHRPHLPVFDTDPGGEVSLRWHIGDDGWARERRLGLRIALRPFMGIMGNAPSEPGRHSTGPPRRVGGNMDCRELVAGSRLLLPVEVPGALFSVGDGHAAQGDGEIGQTALECGMNRVVLTFRIVQGADLEGPQALTPAGYLTMGFGESLDHAAAMALRGIIAHVQRDLGVSRPEAMALCSLAVDLRVTQIVNGGVVGVHAMLPTDRLRKE